MHSSFIFLFHSYLLKGCFTKTSVHTRYGRFSSHIAVISLKRGENYPLPPSVLEQDYPEYEVIVVNDCSDDDTDMLLQRLMQQYSHLRTTNTPDPKFTHGKIGPLG